MEFARFLNLNWIKIIKIIVYLLLYKCAIPQLIVFSKIVFWILQLIRFMCFFTIWSDLIFLQTDFYNPFTVEIQFYIEFFLQNTQRFVVCTINLELLGIAQIPAKFVSLWGSLPNACQNPAIGRVKRNHIMQYNSMGISCF